LTAQGCPGKVKSALLSLRALPFGRLARRLLTDPTGRTVTAVTFVVDTAHCQYCGDLPIERAAHHIAFAEGRRGACRDYLANTAAHARALHIHDPYIEELVERVAALRGEYVIPTVLANGEAVGEA